MNKSKKILLIVSGVLTVVILAVMDIALLPKIKAAAGGINAFDLQSFGYTHDTAVRFLTQLTDEGRALYLHVQIPVDFAFLVVYTVFFALALRALLGNHRMLWLPLALAVADIIENTCTVLMLRAEEVSTSMTTFASGVTLVKTILTYMTITAVLVFALHRFLASQKKKKQAV